MKTGLKRSKIYVYKNLLNIFHVKYFYVFFIIFTFISFNFSYISADSLSWGQKSSSFEIYKNENVKINIDKNGFQSLSLNRKSFLLSNEHQYNSLYLSFDLENINKKSINNKIKIVGGDLLKTNYKPIELPESVGYAASFEQPNHEIWIAPSKYMFLSSKEAIGDFSIFFMIQPYQLKRKMEIIKKMALFEGRKQGFRITWEKDKLVFNFINFFWDNNERPVNEIKLETKDLIELNKFQQILLQYHETKGVLILYLNGIEQERIYTTDNFNYKGSILKPSFHKWDNSPLILGRNFLGALDEVIFLNGILPVSNDIGSYGTLKNNGRLYYQKPGIVISKIVQLPYSNSEILNIDYKSAEKNGSKVNVFIRHSNNPFNENLNEMEMPFYKVNKIDKNNFKTKYIQWKAEFYSDAQGQNSPEIHHIELNYRDNLPPNPPRDLSVLNLNENEVTLHFLRNSEMDVINGGRYHIYYGIKPFEPLGVIRYKDFTSKSNNNYEGITINDKDRWISSDLRYQNRIKININNDVIQKNHYYTQDKPHLQYEYPLLQKNIPFYFWVTSCDNSWTESSEFADHESEPSNFVVVRP
ncbi:MAG: hypothetical protein OEZ22_04530 [Spirochaetia bacterium]|nr:hypothetical protein [Spirochaetia bacterium]